MNRYADRVVFAHPSHRCPADRAPPPQGCGGDGARRDGRGKGEGHEPALEHFIPPILDPTINDTRTEVTDRAASYPRGLEPFLEMGLPLVLIGGIN